MQTANSLTLASVFERDPRNAGFVSAVLALLRARTGFDFSGYRVPTLERRIANRMLSAGSRTREQYLELLESCPAEPQRLLECITIKVSRFYRHRPAFDYLREHVLPELASVRGSLPVRIWSVGCGAGEEAYTLAMLLEHAGIAGTVEASDIDSSALEAARRGVYRLGATLELPSELMIRFLEPVSIRGQPYYRVQDNIRARVQFSQHDASSTSGAPLDGRFDLVSCRNVLIYLQRALQAVAIGRLLDMIDDGGFLCLGEAEWPPAELLEHLEALPHRTRLFRLRPRACR